MPWANPGQLRQYLTLGGPNLIRLLPPPRLVFVAGKREFLQDGAHTYGNGDPIDGRKDDEKSDCRMTMASSMKPANPRILTINGGSSSIKFALYQVGEPLKRGLCGKVDRIGLSGTNLTPEVLGKLVALYDRFSWRGDSDFANRVLSAMRKQFGRHDEKKKGGS